MEIICRSLSLSLSLSLHTHIYIHVTNENNTYVGLTSTTLSRRLTMHLNDSNSIALHLNTRSISKYKFRKIQVQNTTILGHEINKLRLQTLEALNIKTKEK